MQILDKVGNEITVGAWIAYGHALGRCAGLRIGKVLDLKTKQNDYTEKTEYRISVISIDDDWSHRDISMNKKGCLQFPDRILVLNENQIPKKYKELMEKAGY